MERKNRFELLVTGKATGRSERTRFNTFTAAKSEAARYMPTKGTRPFRLSIRDRARAYKESVVFEYE